LPVVLWTEPLLPSDAETSPGIDWGRPWAVGRQAPDHGWKWQALDAVNRPAGYEVGVDMAPALGQDVQVVCRFAERLFTFRAERALVPGPVTLAAGRPRELIGHVRLPHLATVIDRSGHTSDQVIWEQFPDVKLSDWLGDTPAPDWDWLYASLGRLTALRARARTGQLRRTPDEIELAKLIGDRFLSIRAVCLNQGLFRRLLS
jgi:hypothetical protein